MKTYTLPVKYGTKIGRKGEHNATALVIPIPDDLLNCQYYIVEFKKDLDKYALPPVNRTASGTETEVHITENNEIYVPLTKFMTDCINFAIQASGYIGTEFIGKTQMFRNMSFSESINAEEDIPAEEPDIIADIYTKIGDTTKLKHDNLVDAILDNRIESVKISSSQIDEFFSTETEWLARLTDDQYAKLSNPEIHFIDFEIEPFITPETGGFNGAKRLITGTLNINEKMEWVLDLGQGSFLKMFTFQLEDTDEPIYYLKMLPTEGVTDALKNYWSEKCDALMFLFTGENDETVLWVDEAKLIDIFDRVKSESGKMFVLYNEAKVFFNYNFPTDDYLDVILYFNINGVSKKATINKSGSGNKKWVVVDTVPTKLNQLQEDADNQLVTQGEKDGWDGKADVDNIPTTLAELSGDSTHRLVTDTEKTTWNSAVEVVKFPGDSLPVDGSNPTEEELEFINKLKSDYASFKKNVIVTIGLNHFLVMHSIIPQIDFYHIYFNCVGIYMLNDHACELSFWIGDDGKWRVSTYEYPLRNFQPDYDHNLVSAEQIADWNAKAEVEDIPTTLAELSGDSTHRLTTDTEKASWNAKADVEDIPTKTSDLTNDSGYITETGAIGIKTDIDSQYGFAKLKIVNGNPILNITVQDEEEEI